MAAACASDAAPCRPALIVHRSKAGAQRPHAITESVLALLFAALLTADASCVVQLPTGYDPSRPWPILYVADPRGRAEAALEVFREAAAASGYIVASSRETASDTSAGVTISAMQRMWNETHARYSIDAQRVYVAGFSGTARIAAHLAGAAPGSIAGVIMVGAGSRFESAPPFLIFGAAGRRDFNLRETETMRASLEATDAKHRIIHFDGGHQWLTPELGGEALEWFALHAMRSGTVPADGALVARLWEKDVARAASLPPVDALRAYEAMVRDYDGLHEVAEASTRVREMAASPAYRRALKEQRRLFDDEARFRLDAQAVLGMPPPYNSARAIRALGIAALKRKAAGRGPQADSAARMLASLHAQTSFYLPREMEARGEELRARFFREIAAAIR